MQTTLGTRDQITLQDQTVLDVIVERAIDIGDGWMITYSIPSMQYADGRKYYTQEYYYPKYEDYSGIVRTTGMPVDYSDKTLADFRWELYHGGAAVQKDMVSRFLFNLDMNIREAVGLYLWSATPGSGKTFLACLIGNELIKRGMQVKFITVNDYIQAHRNGDSQRYKDCSVLILDDVGAEDDKQEWIQGVLFGLVNARYSSHKLTLFTSNVDIKHCSKNDRMVSRINRMAIPVRMPEYSVRDVQAEEWRAEYMRGWS